MLPLKNASLRKCPSKKSHEDCDPSFQDAGLEHTGLWKYLALWSCLLFGPWLFRLDCSWKSLDVSEKQKIPKDAWHSGKNMDCRVIQTWIPRVSKPHPISSVKGKPDAPIWLSMNQSQEKYNWGCSGKGRKRQNKLRGLFDIKKRGSRREGKTTLMSGFGGFRRAGKLKKYFIKPLELNVHAQ